MDTLIGLGRRREDDARDRLFLIPKRERAAAGVTRRHWFSRGVLDQGSTSQCVAYSGIKYLTSGPILNKPPMTPETLYNRCRVVDEWPGEAYDGTSVRACFRILKEIGLVTEYRWAFECETVINHILTVGPVVVGTEWLTGMFQTDRWSYTSAEGRVVGGHAYLLVGADRERKHPLTKETGAVRIVNSWGSGWGSGGRAWLSFSDLDKLIRADGEAAVATEVRPVV